MSTEHRLPLDPPCPVTLADGRTGQAIATVVRGERDGDIVVRLDDGQIINLPGDAHAIFEMVDGQPRITCRPKGALN